LRERIEAAAGLGASILGLAAYFYLLGGLVWWLRFTAAQLPADQAVSRIDSKRLLATGLKAFLFEAVILAVLMLLALAARWVARKVSNRSRAKPWPPHERIRVDGDPESEQVPRRLIAWSTVLFGICFGVVLVAVIFELSDRARSGGGVPSPFVVLLSGVFGAFGAALFDEQSDKTARLESPAVRWALSIPLGFLAIVMLSAPAGVAILVLIVLAHLSGGLNELPSMENPLKLIPPVLIVGAGLGVVAAAYQATPPVSLDRVVIATQARGRVVGGFIGETSDAVMVAQCRANAVDPRISPDPPKLKVIPKAEIAGMHLGGIRYAFDYGKDPSIFDLMKHYLGRSELGEALDTVSIDPRAARLVCGDAKPFRVLRSTVDRETGRAREKVFLHGAGVISIGGESVEPTQLTLRKGGRVWLPITPVDAARAEVGLLGAAVVQVWTRLEPESGEAFTSWRRIRLFRRSTY
jgi:hypothetical protein